MNKNMINKISYHAVYDKSIIDALKFAKLNGFSGIQIAVETPHLSFERLSADEIEVIRDFVERNNMSISIHCPDESLSLFETSVYLRKGIYSYFNALFDFAERVKTSVITIHIGSITTFPTDSIPEDKFPLEDLNLYKETFKVNLDKVLELAKRRFIICAENYNLEDFILNLLQPYLDTDEIYLCWDLAKNFSKDLKKKVEIENYFIKNVDKIRQVHLHDMNDKGRSHRIIGTGIINFNEYLSMLCDKEIMDYCIEVRPREMANKSLENLKKIIEA